MACFHPRTITLPDGRSQVVRCEKCLDCLQHRQAGWITRLSEEFRRSPDGVYFVTLTYDDDHLPMRVIGGENFAVISSSDIIKFNRDLRKRFQQGFFLDDSLSRLGFSSEASRISLPPDVHYKYYITSEYGPDTKRPHYHGLFSSLPEDEFLVFALLNAVWAKGFITCEKARAAGAAAYVSKYLVNNSLVPIDERLPRPRAWMSKGLGDLYLESERVVEWHRSAPVEHQYALVNGRRAILPRYYRDRIYDDSMKDEILEDCIRRESSRDMRRLSLSLSDLLAEDARIEHDQSEAYRQAEWHFRKNGKIK